MSLIARIALILLFVAGGVALFSVGTLGDTYNWWDERGYLANIVAGTTGACFGIPFAAVVIQWYTRRESDLRDSREVAQRTRNTLEAIARKLNTFVADEDGAALREGLPAVVREHILPALQHGERQLDVINSRWKTDEPTWTAATTNLNELRSFLTGIRILEPEPMQDGWYIISNRWRVLRDELFLRAEARGVSIMDDRTMVQTDRIIARPGWSFDALRELQVQLGQVDEPHEIWNVGTEPLHRSLARTREELELFLVLHRSIYTALGALIMRPLGVPAGPDSERAWIGGLFALTGPRGTTRWARVIEQVRHLTDRSLR